MALPVAAGGLRSSSTRCGLRGDMGRGDLSPGFGLESGVAAALDLKNGELSLPGIFSLIFAIQGLLLPAEEGDEPLACMEAWL